MGSGQNLADRLRTCDGTGFLRGGEWWESERIRRRLCGRAMINDGY